MANILLNFALQIVFTIGIIILFGLLIALCNRQFYKNFGNYGKSVCYITGAIGTPIHECSHALFCLIFFHKIVEIKLFQVNSEDGTLGYVNHSYNKRNIYQRIGNFFIGIAPIIVISALLYLIAWLLLPNFVSTISSGMDAKNFADVFVCLFNIIKAFFMYFTSWQWWVFVLISIFLGLHMTLSKEDIKGSISGLILLLLIVLIVDIVLGFVNANALAKFTQGVMKIGGYLVCILVLALLTSLIAVLISFIFRLIRKK